MSAHSFSTNHQLSRLICKALDDVHTRASSRAHVGLLQHLRFRKDFQIECPETGQGMASQYERLVNHSACARAPAFAT
eukprot:4610606-Pyramimonas_sp.AAC.1